MILCLSFVVTIFYSRLSACSYYNFDIYLVSLQNKSTMAVQLNTLKHVNERDKLAVYSWVRNIEKTHKLSQSVPSLVLSMTILYFRDDEIWDDNEYVDRTRDNKEIRGPGNEGSTIYKVSGVNKICPLRKGKYEWDILIKDSFDHPSKWPICIGLLCESTEKVIGAFYFSNGQRATNCHYFGATTYEYGEEYDKNDKISVLLDTSSQKISFKKNDKDQGIAFSFEEIEENSMWELFVSIRAQWWLEIVKFSRY